MPQAAEILEEVVWLVERIGGDPPREIMNAKEAADFLRLSEVSFRQIAPSLPCHKRPSMSYRYLRSKLLEWLVSQGDDGGEEESTLVEPRKPQKKGKRSRVQRLV